MNTPIKILRKVLVVLISLPLFTLGIVLIPLPGPGLLLCFIALVILSLEFDTAKQYRDKIFAKLKGMLQASRENSQKIKKE